MVMWMRNCYVILAFLLLLSSCSNDPGALGLSNSTFTSDYGVVVLDTMTVAVSTVLLDSIPTSGTGSLLVGGYSDNKLGRLQAEGYVQIGMGSAWEPPANAIFDSLVLIANYSGYWYGDTTQAQTLEVRRVTQAFKAYSLPQFWINEGQYSVLYTENSKFNSSAMSFDVSALGTRSLRIRPNSSDSLTIRLSDFLGQQILQLAKDQAGTVTESDRFLEFFKGIAINNVTVSPSCVVGFNTENLKIRLYYRQYSDEALTRKYHDFPFNAGLFNYSKIDADRSGTVLENLKGQNDQLFAAASGNESFVQSGTGLVTKITFPYITKLLTTSEVLLVNQAQLIIEPVKDSYSDSYPLPANLTLYHTNKTNLPISRVTANYNSSEYQSAYISFDEEFDTSTGYNFMLTEYVTQLLATEGNTEAGLLIMPPADEINSTVNKITFGAGTGSSYRVRLKVWYTYTK